MREGLCAIVDCTDHGAGLQPAGAAPAALVDVCFTPSRRTKLGHRGLSEKCQQRTHAPQQICAIMQRFEPPFRFFVAEHLDRLCQQQLSAVLKSLTRGLRTRKNTDR